MVDNFNHNNRWIVYSFSAFCFFNWKLESYSKSCDYAIYSIAWKQSEPKFNNKQIFMAVLDSRYPKPNKDVGGLMTKMHERKNSFKNKIEAEFESEISDKEKYSLPILIYTCLLIEENNYANQNKTPTELIEPIKQEVIRQGFKKYC